MIHSLLSYYVFFILFHFNKKCFINGTEYLPQTKIFLISADGMVAIVAKTEFL